MYRVWRAERAVGWIRMCMRNVLTRLFLFAAAHMGEAAAAEQNVGFDFDAQIRERFESSLHPGFGLAHPGGDDYLLNRVLLGAEAKAGEHFAMTGEIVGGSVAGAGSP